MVCGIQISVYIELSFGLSCPATESPKTSSPLEDASSTRASTRSRREPRKLELSRLFLTSARITKGHKRVSTRQQVNVPRPVSAPFLTNQ